MKSLTSFFAVILISLGLFFPRSASAIFFQSGDNLTFDATQKFDDTVFVSAQTLTINSVINGDLYCAGRNVIINAKVNGDVFCAAQNLQIGGEVTGSLRAAAQTLQITAKTSQHLLLAGQTIDFQPTATATDLISAGSLVQISGTVSRDLVVAAEKFNLQSVVGRHLLATTANLQATNLASVKGNADLFLKPEATANFPDSVVKGQLNRHLLPSDSPKTNHPKTESTPNPVAWFLKRLVSILSFLLVGALLLRLNRSHTLNVVNQLTAHPFASFFLGLTLLLMTPLVFFLSLISVIGIPLAFLLLLLFFVGLLLSSLYTSFSFTRCLIARFNLQDYDHPVYYLVFGVPLFWLIFSIPIFGGFIAFISLCLGLGAFTLGFTAQASSQ
jgi:cytoskeletal protein CcmA (bactofilin family)